MNPLTDHAQFFLEAFCNTGGIIHEGMTCLLSPYLPFCHLCVFGYQLSSLYFVLLHSLVVTLQESTFLICSVYSQTAYLIYAMCKLLLYQSSIFQPSYIA